MKIKRTRLFRPFLLPTVLTATVLALLAFNACAPVRVLDSSIQTINIPMIANRSLEYGAEERVTDRLIQEFNLDGRLRVSSLASADSILDATLAGYEITSIIRDDRGETIGSRVTVVLDVVLVEPQTGDVLVPRKRFQRAGVFFYETQPGLARESDVIRQVAEDVISYVIEGW